MNTASFETGNSQALALARIISTQVEVIIAEYTAAGQSLPSLHSTTVGPFDTPERSSANLSKAIQVIEGACAQLCATVASPGHVVTNFEEPASMLVVVNGKIADLLLDRPEGVHVDELAKQAKLDSGKLGRILRLLATKHCFTEVKPNVFANNRLSMKLVSTDPVSSLVGHMTDEAQKSSAFLADTLADPRLGPSMLPEDASFKQVHGYSLFDYYKTGEGKERTDRFAQAMVGWAEVTGGGMLPKVYPWESLPEDTTICDVGGGNGHATLALVKAFPKFKIILQDLPDVVNQGKDYWKKEIPDAVDKQRIEFVPLDFFADSPVKDSDFYYIRHVLHDWPHNECIKILTNVRKALGPTSKLLIHEFVLQHLVRDPEQATLVGQAPEPLLPNYGVGRMRLYQQDINMMNLVNSKERTLPEFIEMGKETGFEFVKMWDSGEAALLEFRPVTV
ncbi:3-O-methyltransferase 2 [Hypsizygus marmoreus]|uniref:3-O-methyltransferase 2 n=1 Tax=Hypsizygus marmoreus TaxID=39966 RepID=A0A369K8I8_HYPMA|nr:3-O-methyltransferase 2 [Hypsizygus marmoreus]